MNYFCHDRVGKGFKHCHRRYVPNISAVITINFSLNGVNIPLMAFYARVSEILRDFVYRDIFFVVLKLNERKLWELFQTRSRK